MTIPFSRASWTMRLIGFDSGLTIAMIFPVDTKLPKPIFTILFSLMIKPPTAFLFYILNLFPHFLQLRFQADHSFADFIITCLGADGIDFTVHFLQQKIPVSYTHLTLPTIYSV